MNRYGVSIALVIINIAAISWFATYRTVHAGAMFGAILAGVIGSAIMQRIRFGRDAGWRARLDPVVLLSFIICFDVTLVLATII